MIDRKYGRVTLEKRPDASGDEPCFVLRGQDLLAPIAVRYYADLVEAALPLGGKNAAESIRDCADQMAAWKVVKKLPDGR